MGKFTVEEINWICVFEKTDRADLMVAIEQVLPHLEDDDMEELAIRVLGKLETVTDEEFMRMDLEVVE